jgi:hypothetical protein
LVFANSLLTAEKKKALISLETDAPSVAIPRRLKFKANFKMRL